MEPEAHWGASWELSDVAEYAAALLVLIIKMYILSNCFRHVLPVQFNQCFPIVLPTVKSLYMVVV